MSPPIRDGSGDSIGAIRLGDGSEISEVRTGAGDVLFSAGSVPDSGLLHQYDWSAATTTTSTVPDLKGSDDLSGAFTDLSASINGVQAGSFDGVNDQVFVSFSNSVTNPVLVFLVARLESPNSGSFETVLDGEAQTSSNDNPNLRSTNSDNFSYFQGNTPLTAGGDDNDNHIFGMVSSSTNSSVRIDGVEKNTASGGASVDNLSVGSISDGSRHGNWTVGELLVYDGSQSSTVSEIESFLSNKWGVTI